MFSSSLLLFVKAIRSFKLMLALETALKLKFLSWELGRQSQGGTWVVCGLSEWSGRSNKEEKKFGDLEKFYKSQNFAMFFYLLIKRGDFDV